MTSVLSDGCFVSKLLKLEINLSEMYVPFVIDSDGVMLVKEQLKSVNSIRRYEC